MADLEIKIEHIEFPTINEYDKLMRECIEYMEFIASEDYHEDGQGNYEHAIFEVAMKFVYGEKAFDEINRLLDIQDQRYRKEHGMDNG